jgi:hypothetical protein
MLFGQFCNGFVSDFPQLNIIALQLDKIKSDILCVSYRVTLSIDLFLCEKLRLGGPMYVNRYLIIYTAVININQ